LGNIPISDPRLLRFDEAIMNWWSSKDPDNDVEFLVRTTVYNARWSAIDGHWRLFLEVVLGLHGAMRKP